VIGLDNPLHLAMLLLILLLVFGAKRLPEMGRSLGAGLRGFKESISGESHDAVAELSVATAQRGVTSTTGADEPEAQRPASAEAV
jgi:sec-independent protein translocase protein TatA